MSDWQVGDRAVCVDASGSRCALTVGRVYSVSGLDWTEGFAELDGSLIPCGLLLAEIAPPFPYDGFDPRRFRKILPDQHEACETEFVTLLKRSKRRVVA